VAAGKPGIKAKEFFSHKSQEIWSGDVKKGQLVGRRGKRKGQRFPSKRPTKGDNREDLVVNKGFPFTKSKEEKKRQGIKVKVLLGGEEWNL